MAIAKRSVETMGGSIGLDSTLGQGSRYCFRIPRTGQKVG